MPDQSSGEGSRNPGLSGAGPGKQYFVPSPEPSSKPPETPASPSSPKQPGGRRPSPGTKAPTVARSKPAQRPAAPPHLPDGPEVPPTRQPAGPSGPKGPVGPSTRRRRRRHPWRWVAAIPLLLLLVVGFFVFKAYRAYSNIERLNLEDVLDPVNGDRVNYLLVGSDSRAEFDPEGNSGVTGSRSDTIIVLQTTPDGSKMMSIPRDLWVTIHDTGKSGRINGAYNHGPANLVATVKENLDIPVNHYLEVGFGSFAGLVDAIGGVTIDFPHPAFDKQSGLNVETSGPVLLNGEQALAYARSRHYTEVIDGRNVTDPTADLGRQQRQQTFLRTALSEVGATRNPLTLINVADAVSGELKIDSGLGFMEAVSFVRKLGGSSPETVILPVTGVRKGRAAVVVLDEPRAQEALAQFR